MQTQSALLHRSVELRDRILWCDGDSTMSSTRMADILLECKSIDHIFPDEIDSNVKKFNLLADRNLQLKTTIAPLDKGFDIPDEYLNIDLKKYLYSKLLDMVNTDDTLSDADIEQRISRINLELELFKQYDIENLLRSTIYMVDTFMKHDIVWGTGRGSSCASYSLYLIGIHEVDSIKYDLELSEFFR